MVAYSFLLTDSYANNIEDIKPGSFFSTLSAQDAEALKQKSTNIDPINSFETIKPSQNGVIATDTVINKIEVTKATLAEQTQTQKLRVNSKKAILFTKIETATLLEKLSKLFTLNVASINSINKIQTNRILLFINDTKESK